MPWRQLSSTLVWLAGAALVWQASGLFLQIRDVRRHHLETAAFVFVALALATILSRQLPAAPPETTPHTRYRFFRWDILLLFSAITFGIYGRVLTSGLFADDFVLLSAARDGLYTTWTDLFRPVIFLVWRAVMLLPIDTPMALHGVNLLLHAVNATLVVSLAERWRLGPWALAAGALFVCFPALTEPIVWPSGMQDVLMSTLVLGFLVIVATPKPTAAMQVAGLTAVVLALLTKESAVAAVPLAVIVDTVAHRSVRLSFLTITATVVVGVLVVARLWWLPVPPDYAAALTRYEMKEFLVRPYASLVVPLRRVEVLAMPYLPLAWLATVLGLTCVAARRWSRGHHAFHVAAGGVLFVLASLIAVIRLFYVGDDLLNSRYIYLGTAGWSLFLASLFGEADAGRPRLMRGLLGCLLISWTAIAVAHANVWSVVSIERDRILAVTEANWSTTCAVSSVDGLPSTIDGIPVFINGFPQAMRARIPSAQFHSDGTTADPGCHYRWDGTGLQPVR